jgi:hypothetical protein
MTAEVAVKPLLITLACILMLAGCASSKGPGSSSGDSAIQYYPGQKFGPVSDNAAGERSGRDR